MKLKTFTDGASRGNPGPAGVGVVIFDENDKMILEDCKYIGVTTNNEAEYRALLLALDHAAKLKATSLECFMDSELVQRQLNGQYRVKSERMAELHNDVRKRAGQFDSVNFSHVRREHPSQKIADALANKALDAQSKVRGRNG